ncbi:MAG TPA: hypothetical protein P5081_14425 [Phycisphaerae bacterium]|nr:hypothetical protein [Phycisphaerae bacterium]HRW54065.1 hypothetical protein [Phycisphaerae bacterium]
MWAALLISISLVLAGAEPGATPQRSTTPAPATDAATTAAAPSAATPSSRAYLPEDTTRYREWTERARDNDRRYVASYKRDRGVIESRILRGETRKYMVEDYVLQMEVLGDEARVVDLCCRMWMNAPKNAEAQERLFKIAKILLLEARQYEETLRMAGDVHTEYDKLIQKYNAEPVRRENWCELQYKGDCSSEFHDAFAYFEALVGTERRMDAVILGEKLLRSNIQYGDLTPQSRYTQWAIPEDLENDPVISQLVRAAARAGDDDIRDALIALARSPQTEADLDTFREDVLGANAAIAKRRVAESAFESPKPKTPDDRPLRQPRAQRPEANWHVIP